jgi:hypothetical protein
LYLKTIGDRIDYSAKEQAVEDFEYLHAQIMVYDKTFSGSKRETIMVSLNSLRYFVIILMSHNITAFKMENFKIYKPILAL